MEHIHALRRGLDAVERDLREAIAESKKVPNNQQGMPEHLYEVSQMFSAIGKRLGLSGLESEFHDLKRMVDKLAKESHRGSMEWQNALNGRNRSRSRSRSRRNNTRRSRSVA
jgi:hypothetical protein